MASTTNSGSGVRSPFFLYLPLSHMHVPIAVAAQFNGSSVDKSPYGDALVEMDWTVGQVLQALRESGVDKDTLVVYMSDNGPWDVKCNLSGSKVCSHIFLDL